MLRYLCRLVHELFDSEANSAWNTKFEFDRNPGHSGSLQRQCERPCPSCHRAQPVARHRTCTMHDVVGIRNAGPRFQATELLSLTGQYADDRYGAPVPNAIDRFSRSAETENRAQPSSSRCESPTTWSRTHPGKGSAGVRGENTWTGATSPVAVKQSFDSQSVPAAECTRQASRELSCNGKFGSNLIYKGIVLHPCS